MGISKFEKGLNMETVREITQWFEKAVPNPTEKNKAVQFGCHLEEVAEMLVESGDNSLSDKVSLRATDYKKGQRDLHIEDKEKLLDALCDQIVTALGVGYMMGFDMLHALREVNRSNWSKFENGEPVFNENGKIMKGKDYTPPQLKPFIGGSDDV